MGKTYLTKLKLYVVLVIGIIGLLILGEWLAAGIFVCITLLLYGFFRWLRNREKRLSDELPFERNVIPLAVQQQETPVIGRDVELRVLNASTLPTSSSNDGLSSHWPYEGSFPYPVPSPRDREMITASNTSVENMTPLYPSNDGPSGSLFGYQVPSSRDRQMVASLATDEDLPPSYSAITNTSSYKLRSPEAEISALRQNPVSTGNLSTRGLMSSGPEGGGHGDEPSLSTDELPSYEVAAAYDNEREPYVFTISSSITTQL